jgi:hypothetical protein
MHRSVTSDNIPNSGTLGGVSAQLGIVVIVRVPQRHAARKSRFARPLNLLQRSAIYRFTRRGVLTQ